MNFILLLLAGDVLPAKGAAIDHLKQAGQDAINRSQNFGTVVLDDRPAANAIRPGLKPWRTWTQLIWYDSR